MAESGEVRTDVPVGLVGLSSTRSQEKVAGDDQRLRCGQICGNGGLHEGRLCGVVSHVGDLLLSGADQSDRPNLAREDLQAGSDWRTGRCPSRAWYKVNRLLSLRSWGSEVVGEKLGLQR